MEGVVESTKTKNKLVFEKLSSRQARIVARKLREMGYKSVTTIMCQTRTIYELAQYLELVDSDSLARVICVIAGLAPKDKYIEYNKVSN